MSKQHNNKYTCYSYFATDTKENFDVTWWNTHMDKECKEKDLFYFYGKIEDEPESCYKNKFVWYYENATDTKYTKRNINNNGNFWIEFCEAYTVNEDD